MGDLWTNCKISYHGEFRDRIKAAKLLKCELPVPDSKSYWDGIFADIENKYKRVRDPYPSLFFLTESSETSVSDNIKVKISPPEHTYKPKISGTNTKVNKSVESSFKKQNSHKTTAKKFKFPFKIPKIIKNQSLDSIGGKIKKLKKYSKSSCSHHENGLSTESLDSNKFLNNLQEMESSLSDLLNFSTKGLCQRHKMSQSKSESSVHINDVKESFESNDLKGNISKAPKLGKASLLPSFAKTISNDSLVVAQEYFDAQSEPSTSESQSHTKSSIEVRKDFLNVPNSGFINSQPSYQKLAFIDSSQKEYTDLKNMLIVPHDEILIEKNSRNNSNFKNNLLEKIKKLYEIEENDAERMAYYERKYAYKALNKLRKKRDPKKYIRDNISTSGLSLSSEISTKSAITVRTSKKTKPLAKEEALNFNEIHRNFKDMSIKYVEDNRKFKTTQKHLDEMKSVTIYSSSRSISNSITNLEYNCSNDVMNDILKEIPTARLFNRPYIDKCHACLYKSLNNKPKTTREFPIVATKSKSDVNISSSTSSSSTIGKMISCSEYDSIDLSMIDSYLEKGRNFLKSIMDDKSPDIDNLNDQETVSFDTKHLHLIAKEKLPSVERNTLTQPKDKSLSMQSSDRSKASSLSIQSSDSEEIRQQEDKLPRSKFTAPCHAPVVWRPSLEPLRALKSKKCMSIQERITNLTRKPSSDSDSDSYNINIRTNKRQTTKQNEIPSKDAKNVKKKKTKPLMRIKSASDNTTAFSGSIDLEEIKAKKLLKRAKTTFELTCASGDTKYEYLEEREDVDISSKSEIVSEYENERQNLPYSDIIERHQASSPPSPIMSTDDINDIIVEYLHKDLSADNIFDKLTTEYIRRMENKCKTTENYESKKYVQLGLKLFKALINSRQYIKFHIPNPDLEFSPKGPHVINSRALRRILPAKTYEMVSAILGIPPYIPKPDAADVEASVKIGDTKSGYQTTDVTSSDLTSDLIVHPGTDHEDVSRNKNQRKIQRMNEAYMNPYALFLKKPRRKAIVWRPLRKEDLADYDPELTLKMRAARVLNKICKDFCDWINKLGGNTKMIDEETLQDMFEINFTSDVCAATQVLVKEMPTVPGPVVKARNCNDADMLTNTRKQIMKDLKMEKCTKHTTAFGKTLPRDLRFVPPQNKVASKWLECENLPKDLDTMDVVWDGIMHLDSVREFMKFLKTNPQVASEKLQKNLNQRPQAKVIKTDEMS